MKKALWIAIAGLLAVEVQAADRFWYCKELKSVGLRHHYGQWTKQQFKLDSHAVRQRDDQLDLESFGMLPDTTRCSYDAEASIISCTDYYTLFNLNIRTGDAAMAHALGWVNRNSSVAPVTNDLSVSAMHCRFLSPRLLPDREELPAADDAEPPMPEGRRQ